LAGGAGDSGVIDDDDLEWEEFMEMSDAQAAAMLDREMKKYEASLKLLNRQQLYRYHRSRRLDLCLQQRKLAKQFPDIFNPMLRATQRRLLEARIEYWTGAVVGHS
jgi:hypothetical protein